MVELESGSVLSRVDGSGRLLIEYVEDRRVDLRIKLPRKQFGSCPPRGRGLLPGGFKQRACVRRPKHTWMLSAPRRPIHIPKVLIDYVAARSRVEKRRLYEHLVRGPHMTIKAHHIRAAGE